MQPRGSTTYADGYRDGASLRNLEGVEAATYRADRYSADCIACGGTFTEVDYGFVDGLRGHPNDPDQQRHDGRVDPAYQRHTTGGYMASCVCGWHVYNLTRQDAKTMLAEHIAHPE
jgi:hypothetical protein